MPATRRRSVACSPTTPTSGGHAPTGSARSTSASRGSRPSTRRSPPRPRGSRRSSRSGARRPRPTTRARAERQRALGDAAGPDREPFGRAQGPQGQCRLAGGPAGAPAGRARGLRQPGLRRTRRWQPAVRRRPRPAAVARARQAAGAVRRVEGRAASSGRGCCSRPTAPARSAPRTSAGSSMPTGCRASGCSMILDHGGGYLSLYGYNEKLYRPSASGCGRARSSPRASATTAAGRSSISRSARAPGRSIRGPG